MLLPQALRKPELFHSVRRRRLHQLVAFGLNQTYEKTVRSLYKAQFVFLLYLKLLSVISSSVRRIE